MSDDHVPALEVYERNDLGLLPLGWARHSDPCAEDPAIGHTGFITTPFGSQDLALCHTLMNLSQDAGHGDLPASTAARVNRGEDDDELRAAKRPRGHEPSNPVAPATGADPAVRSLMVPFWMVCSCHGALLLLPPH